jgi:hypothetical protein
MTSSYVSRSLTFPSFFLNSSYMKNSEAISSATITKLLSTIASPPAPYAPSAHDVHIPALAEQHQHPLQTTPTPTNNTEQIHLPFHRLFLHLQRQFPTPTIERHQLMLVRARWSNQYRFSSTAHATSWFRGTGRLASASVRLPGKSGLIFDHILKSIAGGVAEEYGDGGGIL